MVNQTNQRESLEEFAQKYFDVLHGTFSGLNLTALRDFPDFYQKQIIDSLLPLEQSPQFVACLEKYQRLVDVGFGGGFPLLPLAFRKREISYLGMEGTRKKVEAVKIIKDHLGLPFVQVIHQRLEEVFFDKTCVLTFKAVGKCTDYLKKIQAGEEIYVYFYKGPQFFELEGRELKENWEKGKWGETWEWVEETLMKAEGLGERWLIGFKKRPSLPGKGPKGRKPLVNLSRFL